MIEPTQLVIGDSMAWERTESQYSALEWQGVYTLFNVANNYTIKADAHYNAFAVFVGASVTSKWSAGAYDWTFHVTNINDPEIRHTLANGRIQLLPNPELGAAIDGRTHAERMLVLIEAAIEGKASADQLALLKASHNNRDFEQNPELLIKWRDIYKGEVQRNEYEAALRRGERSPNVVRIRFN